MKKNLIVGLLIVNCFNLKGQIDTTKQQLVYGVSLTAILSSYRYHGSTPSLTLNYRRHQFSLGARIPFDGQKITSGKNHQIDLVTDFQYRYRLMVRWEKIRPFAFANFEYGFERYRRDQFYDHTLPHFYGPIFDHSFNYSMHYQTHVLNVCFGLGGEITILNGFYCFLYGGGGYHYGLGEEHWVATDSGSTVYSRKFYAAPWDRVSWIASGGVGFRYHPKQTKKERQDYRKQKRIELSSP